MCRVEDQLDERPDEQHGGLRDEPYIECDAAGEDEFWWEAWCSWRWAVPHMVLLS